MAFLGAMRAGAVAVPVNPLLDGRELGAVADDAEARIAVVSGERGAAVAGLQAAAPRLAGVVTTGEGLPETARDGAPVTRWADLVEAGRGGADPALGADGAYWLCTGGTTGRPKLAMHRPADLRTAWETFGHGVLGVGAGDVVYGFISNRPGRAVAGSCGMPVPGFDVRLLHEDGSEAADETPGALCVRGPSAATGYWRQPERSAQTFVDDLPKTAAGKIRRNVLRELLEDEARATV